MSIEAGNNPSEAGLLKEKLAKLEGDVKLDFIKAEKGKITKGYWDIQSSDQMIESSEIMVLLNTKQILLEKSQTNPHAAYIKAHIEEAKRIGIKLKQLQPRDIRGKYLIADSTKIEIEKITAVKNCLGVRIEELRAQLSNNPSQTKQFSPDLLKKLHLQPRK
ncbi:hypothetical protein KKF69_02845 [Patescibacteria group bacterium]|nr:hypothetical protein [Patescibacteria group bacterium]